MNLSLLRQWLELPEGQGQPVASRRTVLAAGAAAAGSLALGGTAAASIASDAPSQARAPRRPHHFDDRFFNYADPANLGDWVPSVYFDIGAEGDSPGDLILFLFLDDLLDEAGNAVGHDQVRCSTGFRDELLCDASFVLDGRGQITVAGTAARGATELTLAITGGTGEFKRGRGHVRETLLPSGDARFVFTLIR